MSRQEKLPVEKEDGDLSKADDDEIENAVDVDIL